MNSRPQSRRVPNVKDQHLAADDCIKNQIWKSSHRDDAHARLVGGIGHMRKLGNPADELLDPFPPGYGDDVREEEERRSGDELPRRADRRKRRGRKRSP